MEILKKKILLLAIMVVALSTLQFAECQVAEANIEVMVDQPWWRTIGANQTTEFIAHGRGGTPPYTFQWYTTYLDPTTPAEDWITVPVQNSNSSTFKFVASALGRYGISVKISDLNGDSKYQSFQPMGILVTVQSMPVLQPSTTPSQTQSHSISPTPTIPEYPSQTLLILIALIAIAMISIVKKKTSNIPKALNV